MLLLSLGAFRSIKNSVDENLLMELNAVFYITQSIHAKHQGVTGEVQRSEQYEEEIKN